MVWEFTEKDREYRGLSAVVFDLDGVMVTTDGFHYKGWKKLADELGMKFTEEDNHQLRGVSREESLKIMYRLNNRDLPEREVFVDQMTRKNGYYVEFIKQMTADDILPGSLDLLNDLKKNGIKAAIASSSKNAGIVLEKTGLINYMDAVSDGNNIIKSKPDAEVFLIAALRSSAMPWNCIGVEDAAAGITAIHAAGMVSLGIGEQAKEGDMVINSIEEVNVEKLKTLFEEKYRGPNDEVLKYYKELNNR